ncbi:hypothetical protein ACTHPH_04380 [Paenibacillus pasadenensis]|uniref:hypothetical protein n=1 Tax=Paenibacillus pasadenensis TaxID=217090 RepID=UPI0003FA7B67|nr:hypothetical protein [Paenibacillus pasadenensis]
MPVIIALVLLNGRQEDENFLFLKLFGYLFLATLGLRLIFLPIPLGFLLFYFLLRPKSKLNEDQKHAAAWWGLGLYVVSLLISIMP